jgi:hypothetical protein
MERAAAARVAGQAARVLGPALERETEAPARLALAGGLAALAARMEPAEAAPVLALALEKEADAGTRQALAGGLVAVAARLEPAEAARALARALAGTDADTRPALAAGLASVSRRLPPAEFTRVCAEVIATLRAAEPGTEGEERYTLQGGIAFLMQALDPEQAAPLARALVFDLCSRLDVNGNNHFPIVDASLTDAGRPEVSRRATALTTALGLAGAGPLATLPALPAAGEPLRCRLSTQDLVELLKMPTCFGEARKVVLKHLGRRYGKEFASSWDFVRFAQEQHLDLDFTAPPKRPARP